MNYHSRHSDKPLQYIHTVMAITCKHLLHCQVEPAMLAINKIKLYFLKLRRFHFQVIMIIVTTKSRLNRETFLINDE